MTQDLHWLEPVTPIDDLDEGLRACVADPLWLLARQWRLGEHQGQDASSPLAVFAKVTHAPLRYDLRRPDLDPTVVPGEALVEAEPGGWWTIGRRIRLGRAAAPLLPPIDPELLVRLRFGELPGPYELLANEIDGRAVLESGLLAGNAIWNEVPSPAPDRWSSQALTYSARFRADEAFLDVSDHPGGDLDWFSVDAGGSSGAAGDRERVVLTSRLSYPGAPAPRWWQIEDHYVDLGGFSPDRSHLATMLLLDLVLAHSNDWHWFPVPTPTPAQRGGEAPPSSGALITLHTTRVRDSFDEDWNVTPPSGWSLFQVTGLDRRSLVVWPVAVAPHLGPVLDDVVLGIDEDANLAWAIELRAEGIQLNQDVSTPEALAETTPTGTGTFHYLPSTTLPPHWHPYRRTEPTARTWGEWEQGLVADLSKAVPVPRPGPVSRLIGGPSGAGAGRGHVLAQPALPSSGVRLIRRARLARDTAGRAVLWVERQVAPLAGPPASHLRFDVLAEDAPGGSDG